MTTDPATLQGVLIAHSLANQGRRGLKVFLDHWPSILQIGLELLRSTTRDHDQSAFADAEAVVTGLDNQDQKFQASSYPGWHLSLIRQNLQRISEYQRISELDTLETSSPRKTKATKEKARL